VRQITTAVNPFDNVILEICDEPYLTGTPIDLAGAWIAHELDVIRQTEAALPKRHLIAQQVEGLDGPCDFSRNPAVSVIVAQYVYDAMSNQVGGMLALDLKYDCQKPIEFNETAYYPVWYTGDRVGASRAEAWEFVVGGGAGFNQLNGRFTVADPAGNTPDNREVLGALRNLKAFMAGFDFIKMRPDRGFVAGGLPSGVVWRGMSEPGKQYSLYLHHSTGEKTDRYTVTPGDYQHDLRLLLPRGEYKAEWIDPASGRTLAGADFRHEGGERSLATPRHTVDVALRVLAKPESAAAAAPTATGIATYPAPADEALSAEYVVTAAGQPVAVYTARTLDPPFAGKEWDFGGPYAFANFDTAGPVEVRVRAKRSLRDTVVRPASAKVTTRCEDDRTLILSLPGPRKISVEPDGRKGPLLLFANPLETDAPEAGGPGVIAFGPGIHKAGRIDLTNGQTLHLAGGAVVKGGVVARGEKIRICGRGILDSSDYEWRKGPTPEVISIRGTNIEVSGITIRGASHWTIVPRHSRNVTVRGVKLCGSRVQNDDGINPCNSQDVLITDCFIRTDDDCVALKGLDTGSPNDNVERITVENTTLWCDRARIVLLGHESRAPYMRGITLRNLDIIHFTMTAFLFEPGEEMRLEDLTVADVRVHGEGQAEFVRLKPVVNQYMRNKVPGHVRDIRFRNVTVEGQPGPYRVQLSGADAEHTVQDVSFESVTILGVPLTADSERLQSGPNVSGVRFGPAGNP
jgi:hypothetical protein